MHLITKKTQKITAFRCAEFCAGIGGFRLGIEASKLNANIVYANEIDLACEQTYYTNFGSFFDSKDIFDINSNDLPDFDLICAGFPCQPFSIAGKGLGFDDPRGSIFEKLALIINKKRPSVIFLENVPNLIYHNKGKTFISIIDRLSSIGYSLSYKVLDSSFFGVPQSRRRVYIVGFLKKKYGDLKLPFTEKKTQRTALRPFLEKNVNEFTVSDKWNHYIDLYCGKYSVDDIRFEVPKSRMTLERHIDECNIADCILQVRSSGVRAISLNEPFPTFTVLNSGGGAHIPILTKERRHLSLLEMKRIMGFPENFDLSVVSRTNAAKQLANAVCPPVICSICDDIFNLIYSI